MMLEWYFVCMILLNYNWEMILIYWYKCEKLNMFIYYVNIFEMLLFVFSFVYDIVVGFNYFMLEKR